MTNPVYKIETYTGAVLDHTITSDAVSITIKEKVTDAVGQFTIVLPTNFLYEDIALHDKVKIYLGYDTVPTTPNFVGWVQKIEGHFDKDKGYMRQISGLSLGEVLLNRLKNAHYSGTTTANIVGEFATDLGLGSDISAEVSTPTLEFLNHTYFEAMQAISDLWVNAGTQLKRDFYVDVGDVGHADGHLVWKDRPFRTVGVETLEIGTNILQYNVRRSLENMKNSITVYGNWDEYYGTKIPLDEAWTESITNWTATTGTLVKDEADKEVGTASVRCDSAGAGIAWDVNFTLPTLKPTIPFFSGNARSSILSFSRIHFHWKSVGAPTSDYIRLYAPDSANYFRYVIGASVGWSTANRVLPTTDAIGIWTAIGSPQANFITGINFTCHDTSNFSMRIDDLTLEGGRFAYYIKDQTSIDAYGQRDLVVIEDSLQSNAQCESRARALLWQRKDPIVEIEIVTVGNTNILVGDQLTLTLPRESISGSDYHVTTVEHNFSESLYLTKATVTEGTGNIRASISTSPLQELGKVKAAVRALGRESKTIR